MNLEEQCAAALGEYEKRFGDTPDFFATLCDVCKNDIQAYIALVRKAIDTNTPFPDPLAGLPPGAIYA